MHARFAATLALCVAGGPAAAQDPLSAIDWLSDVTTSPLVELPNAPVIHEEEVSRGILSEQIMVSPLDRPNADTVGLLSNSVSGLPRDLWGPSSGPQLTTLLNRITRSDLLPATRDLLFTLLLAELDAPFGSDGSGSFLDARIAALIEFGAIEQAHAMLDRAGVDTPAQYARWFDLSSLLGQETAACMQLVARPSLSDDLGKRVFCLARTGDWAAAALSFEGAKALGLVPEAQSALLMRFLDVELDEGAKRLPIPTRPSALTFTLFEAIGEPLPTTTLPLAYAHADLRANTGWKAQIEAAERLTRAGALPANRLLGLYTERRPAASGGVWDRVAAVQSLDRALASGDGPAISDALPGAWAAMQSVGLEPALAELYAARLQLFTVSGTAAATAFRMGLLTADYAAAAQRHPANGAEELFLSALATGQLDGAPRPNALAEAIADAFAADAPPERFRRAIQRRAIGATLLEAIDLIGTGRRGDLGKVTEALALFRALRLDDVAHRAALELMILDHSG